MARYNRLLSRILGGRADRNIRFDDLCRLLVALGFAERVRGDHHIYTRLDIMEIVNLQPLGDGMAKPYQVRQVRELIVKYKLTLEDRS